MAKTIVASYDSFDEAQRVARELLDEGFEASDLSVVASNVDGAFMIDERVKVTDASGTATGAMAGGVLGGAAGLAASLMGLAIPGLGPVIAAGPIAATLSVAGAGVIAGGLIGSLTDLGVPQADAEAYAEAVRRGGAIVTVRAADEATAHVVEIMRAHGAIDIDRRTAAWRERGWSGFDAGAAALSREDVARDRELDRESAIDRDRAPDAAAASDPDTVAGRADPRDLRGPAPTMEEPR
jgi:uncharacterized membrane protein